MKNVNKISITVLSITLMFGLAGLAATFAATDQALDTATSSDFTITVDGTNVSPSSFVGSEDGVVVTLDAGSYTITESSGPAGYVATSSGDCAGTITVGETKTCTIAYTDIIITANVPQLSSSGLPPNENAALRNIMVPTGLFAISVSFYVTRRKTDSVV